ncbi:Transient receptor putative cation channel sub M member 2 [Sparganum proliferum]
MALIVALGKYNFLVDHRENCDLRGCSAKIMRDFLLRRVNHVYPDEEEEEEEEEEEQEGQQSVRQQLIRSITGMHFALILPEDDSQELARWYDFSHPIHLRPSHETPLHLIYQYYEAT